MQPNLQWIVEEEMIMIRRLFLLGWPRSVGRCGSPSATSMKPIIVIAVICMSKYFAPQLFTAADSSGAI